MIITYDGTDYPFDFEKIRVKQAIKIERHMGCTITEWGDQLSRGGSMLALQALGWLVLNGGRDIPIEDTDFEVAKLGEAFAAALEDEPDPTPPNGQAPAPAAAVTSS